MKITHQSGFLRPLLLALLGLAALLLVALLIVSLLRIPLNLDRYKPVLETAVADALGREVRIDGDIIVTTSLWPYFEISGLQIANPAGFDQGTLAGMEQARITLGLLPLLERKIRIRQFKVNGLSLLLQRDEQGKANWVLDTGASGEQQEDTDTPDSNSPALAPDSLAIDDIVLEDIQVTFQDAGQEPLEFALDSATGAAAAGEPMSLSLAGTLLEEAFTLEVRANTLADFLAMTRSQLGMQLDIAGTRLDFSGLSEALGGGRSSELHVRVQGEDLSSLDQLLQLDLPPIKDYRLEADLRAVPDRLELTSLEAAVQDSLLRGHMVIDRTGARPFATAELKADTIQLRDFDTGDWSPEQRKLPEESASAEEGHSTADQQAGADQAKLLSPEALQRVDASLVVSVAEVLSGDDQLGSGELKLGLKDGRISLDPLHLQLPQASLLMQASLKPGKVASEASLRVLIKNFNIGVLARLSDPDSDLGGRLDVDVDVTAAASNTNIMSGANGYFDVSGQLENFHSTLVDLWAVNLLSAVVTSSNEEENISEINCLVSRSRLAAGVMNIEQLAVDTSKIRICGEGEIRFTDRSFNLVAAPKAKRPEFFSLATPLAVKGEFDDIDVGTRAGVLSVGTTAVKFAVSPVTTPVKRLFKEDLPEDGADICSLPIGPREAELEPLPGC